MTKTKLQQLYDLTGELLKERMDRYEKEHPDFYDWDDEEQYNLDDGDRLIEGCDIVQNAIMLMLEKM